MDILAVNVIGVVPDDESIVISTNQGEPLVGMGSLAGQAFLNICRRIMGEQIPFLSLDVQPKFITRLSRILEKLREESNGLACISGHHQKPFRKPGQKTAKVVLVTDKVDCSPELIDRMKDDMIRVISKYMTMKDRVRSAWRLEALERARPRQPFSRIFRF